MTHLRFTMMTRLPVMLSTVSKINITMRLLLWRLWSVASWPEGRDGKATISLGVVDGSGLTEGKRDRWEEDKSRPQWVIQFNKHGLPFSLKYMRDTVVPFWSCRRQQYVPSSLTFSWLRTILDSSVTTSASYSPPCDSLQWIITSLWFSTF